MANIGLGNQLLLLTIFDNWSYFFLFSKMCPIFVGSLNNFGKKMKNYDLILILLYFILNTQPEIQILKGNPSLILLVGTNYKIKGRFVFSPIKGCLVIFHKKPRWLFDMKHRFLGINVILFFAKIRVYLHSFSRNIWSMKKSDKSHLEVKDWSNLIVTCFF